MLRSSKLERGDAVGDGLSVKERILVEDGTIFEVIVEGLLVLRPGELEHGDGDVVEHRLSVEHRSLVEVVELGVEEGLVDDVRRVEEGNLSALLRAGNTALQPSTLAIEHHAQARLHPT
jgi:hypothetical protein